MRDPDQRARTYAILGGFLCLLLLNNALWLHLDSTPLTTDEAHHFSNSVTHFIYPLLGFNPHAAIFFIHSVFSILLMFALYGLSNFFCRERETSIVASLLWTTWPGLLYYGIDFVRSEASPLGAALFLLGAAFFLKKRMPFERYLLLAWVVPAVLILTFFRYKVSRYALPYLPAVALITMAGVNEIKRKALRNE